MEITISLDLAQAAYLSENLHETTPEKIAEILFARHIAEYGGPLPERFNELIEWEDFMNATESALNDHVDLDRGVAAVARAKGNSHACREERIQAAVRTTITRQAVRRAFHEGEAN